MLEPTRLSAYNLADALSLDLHRELGKAQAGPRLLAERLCGGAAKVVTGIRLACDQDGDRAALPYFEASLADAHVLTYTLDLAARTGLLGERTAKSLAARLREMLAALEGLTGVVRADAAGAAAVAGAGGADGESAIPEHLREPMTRLHEHFKSFSPYLVSRNARETDGRLADPTLTYGVTPPWLMLDLLAEVGATRDDVFYDLGCGVGHNVLVASYVCGKAKGIELLPPLYEAACEARAALGITNAELIQGDLTKTDVSDGTIFFSYSTCFNKEIMGAMAAQIATAKSGTRAITVTQELVHDELVLEKTLKRSWSEDRRPDKSVNVVYVYRRR